MGQTREILKGGSALRLSKIYPMIDGEPLVPYLRKNHSKLPATPAEIRVLPVPMQPRIDFPVVAGNLAKTQKHPSNANHA